MRSPVHLFGAVKRHLASIAARGTDEELPAPPEAEVLALLRDNEGWAWQADIQTALCWSAAKTSEVLTEMESEGSIGRQRIGRSKVAYRPGSAPDLPPDE